MSKPVATTTPVNADTTQPLENSRRKFTMEFDAGDILMMADALSIASATAMMCGGKPHDQRLRYLQKQFLALSPVPKSSRTDGYSWFSACQKLREANTFEAYAQKESGYSVLYKDKALIQIEVDDKVFKIGDYIPEEEAFAAIEKINAFLEEISPISADALHRIDIQVVLPKDGNSRWSDEKLKESVMSALSSAFDGEDLVFKIRSMKNDYSYEREKGDAVIVTFSAPARSHEKMKTLIADANQANEAEENLSPKP